jgi:hypothetical protein
MPAQNMQNRDSAAIWIKKLSGPIFVTGNEAVSAG